MAARKNSKSKKTKTPELMSRAQFLKIAGISAATIGAAATGFGSTRRVQSPPGSPTLDPISIPKFAEPLFVPPAMPPKAKGKNLTAYDVAAREFKQQMLPYDFPMTKTWGYGALQEARPGDPGSTFSSPSYTIETRKDELVRIKWVNDLKGLLRDHIQHMFSVDQTLCWANPRDPDSKGGELGPYYGPVPIVTHVHGVHASEISNGHPEAWYIPDSNSVLSDYHANGSFFGSVIRADLGEAFFEYPNDQRAAALWYRDHTLGISRLNVYAGLSGFWIIRDREEDRLNLPGPAPQADDAPDARYYEIPLVIQDRSFNKDGSLFYPDSREYYDGYGGPYVPETDISPAWNPVFFGNTIVVNGKTWPYLEIEPRLYRFRLLNACDSRFLLLKFDQDIQFTIIGNDGGLLPGSPVATDEMLMAPGERYDVIVDFSGFEKGDEITLLNIGPDEAYRPGKGQAPADPETTGQVMRFTVGEITEGGNMGEVPETLPPIGRLKAKNLPQRTLMLSKQDSVHVEAQRAALAGAFPEGALDWSYDITESPALDSTEVWNIHNLADIALPIHMNSFRFQVLGRADILGTDEIGKPVAGKTHDPEPWERGWKDTVIVYPGQATSIIVKFDLEGLYAWECSMLSYQDNEMKRPFRVVEK